jgi:hypothetical protein
MGNLFATSEETAPVTQEDFEFEKKEETGNAEEGAEKPETSEKAEEQTSGKAEKKAPEKGNALILGKYKTTDELIKAHEALQKRLGDMRNELGNLRKQQPQQEPQQAEEQQTEGQWTDEQWQDFDRHMSEQYQKHGWKAIWELAVDAARQAVTPLQEVINNQQLTSEQSRAIDSELSLLNAVDEDGNPIFPDAEELTADIENFLDKHPYFNDLLFNQYQNRKEGKLDEYDMGVLEVLYKAVKAEKVESLGKQAYAKGLQQGAAQMQAKAGAQMQKPGAKNTNTEPSPEEQIVNDIFAHKRGGFFV